MYNDIIKVFFTNVIKIFTTLITTFIIPKFLSIDNYALLKLYQLYTSYIGVFHLGFVDGVFLKYGGKSISCSKDKKTLYNEHKVLFIYEILITFIFLVISFLQKDIVMFFFSLSFIPTTLIDFYRNVYQSIGNFDAYSKLLNFLSILNLLANIFVIFILKKNNYIFLLIAYTIVNYIVLILALCNFSKIMEKSHEQYSFTNIFINLVKSGILLMLGNFSYIFFLSIDKWFINYFLSNIDFAFYSFSSSLLSIINMFINPISLTLFTYICKNNNLAFYNKTKRFLILLLEIMLLTSFVFDLIVSIFIKTYIPAIGLTYLLIFAQIIISYNITLYVNLFKVKKMQNKYFLNLIFVVIFSIIINYLSIILFKNVYGITVATVISMIFWTVLNIKSMPLISYTQKELLQVLIVVVSYFICSILNNTLIALGLFILILFLCILFEYKVEIQYIIKITFNKLKNILQKIIQNS